ncbi:NYN domain-containing protein [Patescibacteria group bacterium]|jgi:uncharacterized LabA/DUF88 family protein|nr:NYN domain-containing protein [Patescibacteria group bacterium]MCL5114267.1 NYN domain-containing protein [Patescibacteria group bacterium]
MSNTNTNQRVGIFIDVQNIYHSAKNLYHARVNFNELLKYVVGRRQLVRAYAYVVKSDPATGEESFFEALRKTGLELRSKDLQVYPDGTKKGDWDVGIAVDAIRSAGALDAVILVTGDGDFVPLVQYLKLGFGKDVEVAAFGRTTSARLKDAADSFADIEHIPRALLKINERVDDREDRNRDSRRPRRPMRRNY